MKTMRPQCHQPEQSLSTQLKCGTSMPYSRKFWRGIYFGGLAVLRAICQYFHLPNTLQYDVINTCTLLHNLRMCDKYIRTRPTESAFDSCVRGHHVSKEFWTPNVGEGLSCQRKEGHPIDLYAVAVKTEAGTVIGHVPRKISAACCLFLSRSDTIVCKSQAADERQQIYHKEVWKFFVHSSLQVKRNSWTR